MPIPWAAPASGASSESMPLLSAMLVSALMVGVVRLTLPQLGEQHAISIATREVLGLVLSSVNNLRLSPHYCGASMEYFKLLAIMKDSIRLHLTK